MMPNSELRDGIFYPHLTPMFAKIFDIAPEIFDVFSPVRFFFFFLSL